MSVRLYIGNLPQTFEAKELETQLTSVGEGIRFKTVLDRETGACRGFGFANVDDEKVADLANVMFYFFIICIILLGIYLICSVLVIIGAAKVSTYL